MKNSSVKMIWQAIALASIVAVAIGASLFSCKKANISGNNSHPFYTSENKKTGTPAVVDLPVSRYTCVSLLNVGTASCKKTKWVENKITFPRQTGFIYIIL